MYNTMASKKPPKTELVAICKLEFYRRQKNWKFCAQDRKAKDSKRRTKATNTKLNQTYNIAPAPKEVEPADPEIPDNVEPQNLDEAFVETESGTALEPDEPVVEGQDFLQGILQDEKEKASSQSEPPGCPYSPHWSIQRWAEQRRLWTPQQACHTINPMSTHPNPTRIKHDPTHPQKIVQDTCPIFDNNYNRIQQDIYSSQNINFHSTNYSDLNSNVPTHFQPGTKYISDQFDPKYGASVFYYNSKCYRDDVQCEVNVLDMAGSGEELHVGSEWEGGEGAERDEQDWCAGEGAWGERDWAAAAELAGGPGGEDAVDGDWRLDLSRSDSAPSATSSEFLLGAALGPHSTQVDLLLGAEPASALSEPALEAAVARHAAALRGLLAEAQRRRETPQAADVYGVDEIPVRDPGQYHVPPRPFNDTIVAGTHRTAPDRRGQTAPGPAPAPDAGTAAGEGRGRRRLKVGIRMGRPYRL